jgi:hypothetical protein
VSPFVSPSPCSWLCRAKAPRNHNPRVGGSSPSSGMRSPCKLALSAVEGLAECILRRYPVAPYLRLRLEARARTGAAPCRRNQQRDDAGATARPGMPSRMARSRGAGVPPHRIAAQLTPHRGCVGSRRPTGTSPQASRRSLAGAVAAPVGVLDKQPCGREVDSTGDGGPGLGGLHRARRAPGLHDATDGLHSDAGRVVGQR